MPFNFSRLWHTFSFPLFRSIPTRETKHQQKPSKRGSISVNNNNNNNANSGTAPQHTNSQARVGITAGQTFSHLVLYLFESTDKLAGKMIGKNGGREKAKRPAAPVGSSHYNNAKIFPNFYSAINKTIVLKNDNPHGPYLGYHQRSLVHAATQL